MSHPIPNANQRWKERSREIAALSFAAAAGIHFLVFQMSPEFTAPDWARAAAGDVEVLRIEDIPIPVRPQPLTRPAAPVISADAPSDATVSTLAFEDVPDLPPPPPVQGDEGLGRSDFFPYDLAPRLTNGAEVQGALERVYPAALRDIGVGGIVSLQLFIDETGRVVEGRVAGSSGYAALDEAALGLTDVMRFSPAMNRDKRVPVWVQIPIEFRTRGGAR